MVSAGANQEGGLTYDVCMLTYDVCMLTYADVCNSEVQEEWYMRERIKKEGSSAGAADFWENLPLDEMLEVSLRMLTYAVRMLTYAMCMLLLDGMLQGNAYADVCCAYADVCYAYAAVGRDA